MSDELADEIEETIDWMLEQGYLEYHPDDLGKPGPERRLRITPAGEVHRAQVDGRLAQRENAHLS